MQPLISSEKNLKNLKNSQDNDKNIKEVKILSSARLHFGFLDMLGSLGRKFGSIGMSICAPQIAVRARFEPKIDIYDEKTDENMKRALGYAKLFYENPAIKEFLAGKGQGGQNEHSEQKSQIFLDKTIPAHQGLGSGTQLGLCVISALSRLHGIALAPQEAALISGRAVRSGIGLEAFARGGFIIDTGALVQDTSERKPPLVAFRQKFPKNWRVILVFPNAVGGAATGLSGEAEKEAFIKMRPRCECAKEICHIAMMKLIPGLLEEDIASFADAIERVQRITGEIFAQFQSGIYASPLAEDIFNKMRSLGALGMGQSSWGPVLYGFTQNAALSEHITKELKQHFADNISGVTVTSGRNSGAVYSVK